MVAYLQKSEGSEGFHQIIDFLNASHIQYALTENPTIYVSFIKQFWRTATARTSANGEVELTATIDGQVKTITEASLRRHLKLEDNGGVTTLPNSEIFEQLALMGYVTDSDKLTFQKGHFSPQWKFLIHTILHCLSPKKTAWEQFSSNIATAIICLATNRTYNFSKLIFDAMIKNLENPHKFLMYPRFIQICLNKQKRLLQPHTRTYPTPILTQKVFSNMKRVSRGYSRIDFSLFPTMISAPETSPSRITSSPSLSPQPHTSSRTSFTSQPTNTHPLPDEMEGSNLEEGQEWWNDDEEDLEDPSKQGRNLIEELDMDDGISLVPPHAINEGRNDDTHIYDLTAEQLGVFSAATALADAAKRKRRRVLWCKGQKIMGEGKQICKEFKPLKKVQKNRGFISADAYGRKVLAKKVFEEEQAKAMAKNKKQGLNFLKQTLTSK
ncbi:hypothetical protein Tco_0448652 [Tanacetum coccineum]